MAPNKKSPRALRMTPGAQIMAPAPRGAGVLAVTVVLLEDGFASTAIGPIEVFHTAGRLWNVLTGSEPRPRFRVRVASIDGRPVGSLCSVALTPECSIADIEHTDIVVIPAAGMDEQRRIARDTPLLPFLQKWHDRGAYIAGVCAGVEFLAESGLLNGRRATTHWALAQEMQRRYPKVLWQPDRFVTEDGRLLCSGGVYCSIDLSLYMVEKFCGHEIAVQCARALQVGMPRTRESGYSVLPLARPHDDAQVSRAEIYLQQNFDRDVSIAALASRVGMSPRNFIRRFKAATGRLPNVYVQTLRMSAARELIERGETSIQSVSSQVGYGDPAFFRALFKRYMGMTPTEYRGHFARMSVERGERADAGADAGAPARANHLF